MADLTPEQKVFVVCQLAMFYPPSEVAKQFKEEFPDADPVSKQQISRYNPKTVAGQELSDELKLLYEETRKLFISDRSEIAIAHQNFRLRELQNLYYDLKANAPPLAAKMLEQAAKDEGGLYQRRADDKGDDSADTLPAEFDSAINKIYGDKPAEPAEGMTEGGENVSAQPGE